MNLQENILRIREIIGIPKEKIVEQKLPLDRDNTSNRSIDTSSKLIKYYETINACKSSHSQTDLDKAINWWINWLNNKTTKEKYARNYNLSLDKVNKIFEDYKNAIKGTKIKYVIRPARSEIAYVREKKWTHLTGWNFSKTIHVNCSQAKNRRDSISTFVHELSHIIDVVKPFTPNKKIQKDFETEKNKTLKQITSQFNKFLFSVRFPITDDFDSIVYFFMMQGVPHNVADDWAVFYLRAIKTNPEYVKKETEILARISSIRKELKKMPGQDITLNDILKLSVEQSHNLKWLIAATIHSGKKIQEILNLINLYAKTEQSVNHSDMA